MDQIINLPIWSDRNQQSNRNNNSTCALRFFQNVYLEYYDLIVFSLIV